MQILNGVIQRTDMTKDAKGGTELIAERMVRDINPELLKEFQIIFSRLEFPLEQDKIRIYYCHDLPGDPAANHLSHEGWKKFHRIVFVSNWQMNGFMEMYNIPPSRCQVMLNSIVPIEEHTKTTDRPIKLGYWSTPHRGLEILVPVFEKLQEEYDNIELDVFSSFKLYGWEQRDEHYQAIFDRCRSNDKINYYGTVPNEELRDRVKDIDILAYPSIWMETSCLTLMEAMSAGCIAVHPNLGALYETAANWTVMYQFNEDPNGHAVSLLHNLKFVIENVRSEEMQSMAQSQKGYVDTFYNWNNRKTQWEMMMASLLEAPRKLPKDPKADMRFVYSSG